MSEVEALKNKLRRACETLEAIRTDPGDATETIERHLSFWLGAKRQAGDVLIDIGALQVIDGKACFIGIE